MTLLRKNKNGNIAFRKNKHINFTGRIGNGLMDLNPVTSGMISGVSSLGKPLFKKTPVEMPRLTNYQVNPAPRLQKALSSISMPYKKLNNLKFEL